MRRRGGAHLLRRQSDMRVEQAMQCLGAFRQFGKIAILQRHGERVEQAPHVASSKGIMAWLAPFIQHRGNQPVAAHADIRGPDDQIMRIDVGDLGFHRLAGREADYLCTLVATEDTSISEALSTG